MSLDDARSVGSLLFRFCLTEMVFLHLYTPHVFLIPSHSLNIQVQLNAPKNFSRNISLAGVRSESEAAHTHTHTICFITQCVSLSLSRFAVFLLLSVHITAVCFYFHSALPPFCFSLLFSSLAGAERSQKYSLVSFCIESIMYYLLLINVAGNRLFLNLVT